MSEFPERLRVLVEKTAFLTHQEFAELLNEKTGLKPQRSERWTIWSARNLRRRAGITRQEPDSNRGAKQRRRSVIEQAHRLQAAYRGKSIDVSDLKRDVARLKAGATNLPSPAAKATGLHQSRYDRDLIAALQHWRWERTLPIYK